MSDTVIEVENISKQYHLGVIGSGTLAQDMNRFWAKIRGKEDPTLKISAINKINTIDSEYIWALKNINFKVKKGEVLGIIGKNGAGKSTLLKILSRVTAPTTGKAKIKGRIASLLEVGTGFHKELTGRENIFLNGAILGMTKSEIRSKLDEIIDFSGIEKYIDTPVKRYSSGMYVRLAFAVAAHMEPEILIVDEVLAVGDAEFQKKALGKMQNVTSNEGRTVLFVSHNMGSISHLCNRGIVLDKGIISYEGNQNDAINFYTENQLNKLIYFSNTGLFNLTKNQNKNYIKNRGMLNVELFIDDKLSCIAYSGCNFRFNVAFETNNKLKEIVFGFVIKNLSGTKILGVNNRHYGLKLNKYPVNEGKISVEFLNFPIYGEGNYFVDLYFGEMEDNFDVIENAFYFHLNNRDVFMSGRLLDKKINQFYFNEIKMKLI